MPIDIEEHSRGLHLRCHGLFVPYEIAEIDQSIETRPDWLEKEFHIWDFSPIAPRDSWSWTKEMAATIARKDRRKFAQRRAFKILALVASSTMMKDRCLEYLGGNPMPPGKSAKLFSDITRAWVWIDDELNKST